MLAWQRRALARPSACQCVAERERPCRGDRIATRRNDPALDVANRETWTVTGHSHDGSLEVSGRTGVRTLPAA